MLLQSSAFLKPCRAFASSLTQRLVLLMKILAIDNDSERLSTLKSLEVEGHLVQTVEALSEVTEFLDRSFCQILMLGPDQLSGGSLKAFTEWRQTIDAPPWVVALGARKDVVVGIDHELSIPFDKADVMSLPGLSGVPTEPVPINYNRALEICDDDQDLFHEIAGIFLNDGPGRIETLKQGMQEKNWETVMESAHLMKGSALNLAANSFRLVTHNLEKAADAGNTALIPLWFEQVVYEFGRLEDHMRGLIGDSEEPQ